MKIVRLTTLLDFGGQEKQYISFTDKKNLLTHEYIFAAIGYGGKAEKTLKDRGFQVKIFNLPVSHKNWRNIFIIKKWLEEVKPDIVHTAAAEANFHGIIAAKLAGVPIIIGEEIGIPSHSKLARLTFKIIYKFADKVIGVSRAVVNQLVKLNEIPLKKGITIYNPVSEITSPVEKKPSTNFQWIYVGRLSKVKNVSLLLKCFSNLPASKRGILHIVGDGEEKSELKALCNQLNIEKEVVFHGYSSTPESFLSQADAFVLPSLTEGFGIAVVEAMFLGLPVICSNVGGIPEFIHHNENGFLFNPHHPQELTSLMNQVLGMNKKDLSEIGLKGKSDVIQKFTVEQYVEQMEQLYENIKTKKIK